MVKFQEITGIIVTWDSLLSGRQNSIRPLSVGAVLVSHQFPETVHFQTCFGVYFNLRNDIFFLLSWRELVFYFYIPVRTSIIFFLRKYFSWN